MLVWAKILLIRGLFKKNTNLFRKNICTIKSVKQMRKEQIILS
ncbi:hypothetical protein M153_3140004089 [Pseudoloma neurophilia]|uniref:Uncharacterized protein n=1 Tax=Pseudoloma neurophilia TaxID=146866 RepID=A0A0R0M5E3_9MICR|nr:hypothetical protein M153_3140004089 [Pseudoloma neurophilia]